MAGIATWDRRSSVRSELREARIIPARPTMYGTITRSPTVLLEYLPDSDFTNWGVQKFNVYKPIISPK
jgi:hypothetical protein